MATRSKASSDEFTAAWRVPTTQPAHTATVVSAQNILLISRAIHGMLDHAVRRLLAYCRFRVEEFDAHAHPSRGVDKSRCHLATQRIRTELKDVVGYADIMAPQHPVPDGKQDLLQRRTWTF